MKVTILNEKLGMLCFEMTTNGIIGTGQEFPRDENGDMSREGAVVKPTGNEILQFLQGGDVSMDATRPFEYNDIVAKLLWGRDFGMDLTKTERHEIDDELGKSEADAQSEDNKKRREVGIPEM